MHTAQVTCQEVTLVWCAHMWTTKSSPVRVFLLTSPWVSVHTCVSCESCRPLIHGRLRLLCGAKTSYFIVQMLILSVAAVSADNCNQPCRGDKGNCQTLHSDLISPTVRCLSIVCQTSQICDILWSMTYSTQHQLATKPTKKGPATQCHLEVIQACIPTTWSIFSLVKVLVIFKHPQA